MPVFSIPLSGLSASSQALSVIANNLANLNTVGYKDQRVSFRDLFYQTMGMNGAGDPLQVGAGTAIGSISSNFNGGNVENTGVPTDVAIMGDGFFVTEQDNTMSFTRAGNFSVNTDGELTTEDGRLVMGYPAVNGVLATGQQLAAIRLSGQLSPPSATSSMEMRLNLDSGTAVGASYSTPMTVYDSLGNTHVLTYNFTKTAANAWNYNITIPAADTGASGAPTVVTTGSLTFNGAGALVSPAADVQNITVSNLSNGANPLSLTWRLIDSNGSPMLTQTAAPSSPSATNQNGFASGSLKTFTIGEDGTVQGTFSNGRTMYVGQIALANFANTQGLQRTGANGFLPTLSSGAAVIGAPGSGGRGKIAGGALELSNVDIAQEFSKMIITQRGFQANARVVTTFDEITQDTINLKR